VGLEVQSHHSCAAATRTPLEVGNVVTIEPGIYVPGRFGLRYENTTYVGADGPEELNKTPREHLLG
jgi:Xaa-Pro aminopeptidase